MRKARSPAHRAEDRTLRDGDRGTLFPRRSGRYPAGPSAEAARVLQEQEFERLGSTHTHRVDVRLVARTNRDLSEMVRRSEFRVDLYLPLNVFPILAPPLRDRREDIPILAMHYVDRFSAPPR
jgi:transcriptional regulator with GAF, ATPase, and Fis domain